MRFDVRQMAVSDIDVIEPQPRQAKSKNALSLVDWDSYWGTGFALTATWDGKPIAVAGMIEHLPGIAEGWALFGRDVGPTQMVPLFRSISRVVDSELKTAYHRFQVNVDKSFPQAVRMARMLRMRQEGVMVDYPTPGRSSILFSRLKHGS